MPKKLGGNREADFVIPDSRPTPLDDSGPESTIRFIQFEEIRWNNRRLVHMIRIITHPKLPDQIATLVIGFPSARSEENDNKLALRKANSIHVLLPNAEERRQIENDLKQLYGRDVAFYSTK